MNFCDTHGLDLPCKKCMDDRQEEVAYLKSIEEAMQHRKENETNRGGNEYDRK